MILGHAARTMRRDHERKGAATTGRPNQQRKARFDGHLLDAWLFTVAGTGTSSAFPRFACSAGLASGLARLSCARGTRRRVRRAGGSTGSTSSQRPQQKSECLRAHADDAPTSIHHPSWMPERAENAKTRHATLRTRRVDIWKEKGPREAALSSIEGFFAQDGELTRWPSWQPSSSAWPRLRWLLPWPWGPSLQPWRASLPWRAWQQLPSVQPSGRPSCRDPRAR